MSVNDVNHAIAEDLAENPDCPRCGQSFYTDCDCYNYIIRDINGPRDLREKDSESFWLSYEKTTES